MAGTGLPTFPASELQARECRLKSSEFRLLSPCLSERSKLQGAERRGRERRGRRARGRPWGFMKETILAIAAGTAPTPRRGLIPPQRAAGSELAEQGSGHCFLGNPRPLPPQQGPVLRVTQRGSKWSRGRNCKSETSRASSAVYRRPENALETGQPGEEQDRETAPGNRFPETISTAEFGDSGLELWNPRSEATFLPISLRSLEKAKPRSLRPERAPLQRSPLGTRSSEAFWLLSASPPLPPLPSQKDLQKLRSAGTDRPGLGARTLPELMAK